MRSAWYHAAAGVVAASWVACAPRGMAPVAEPWVLAGQLTYRERIALPPTAVALIELIEVSATANVRTVAAQRVEPAGQVPIRFELTYEGAAVDTARNYALRARIEDGAGRVLFHRPQPVNVEPWSGSTIEMLLYAANRAANDEAAAQKVEFACEGMRFAVEYPVRDRARVIIARDTFDLSAVRTASGARYANDRVDFWNRGDEATFIFDGRTYNCRVATATSDPWQRVRAAGVDMRAIGQEPGWTLDLVEGDRIVLVTDYGGRSETFRRPIRSSIAGGGVKYIAFGDRPLEVLIEERPCADTMSGEPFTLTVTVITVTDTLRGCGRWLNEADETA